MTIMAHDTSPILNSLLDTDAYKLHMQQAVYHRYRDVEVAIEFRCRSQFLLGEFVDQIKEQIVAMGHLTLTADEFDYLSTLPVFQSDYLHWLKTFRFQPHQVEIRSEQGQLHIHINGPWLEVILWEVPLLAVISEVVHRQQTPHIGPAEALQHLQQKLQHFRQLSANDDLAGFRLIDFGTRRRFSRDVQRAIVATLQQEFPWLIGTSNYSLAKALQLHPVGTQAHEWFQAHQQIASQLADSQRMALEVWLAEYADKLGIALTDCITTDVFLRDFTPSLASRYQGLRHDSADPIEWGEKVLSHYQQLNIDPLGKMLIFSDNLDLEKALHIYRHFSDRVQTSFGIGTRLTCNIPTVTPLNIVIKMVTCNGKPVAKISDSPGKTICKDADFVQALRQAFTLTEIEKE